MKRELKEHYSFEELRAIVAELREPDGCPWDRAQTYDSLKKCTADEAQEVLDAVDHKDMENLKEELGEASKTADQILAQVSMDDLRKFGMIPEFIGRLPVLATLETLTVEYMVRILKEPKNAILKQYQKLMAMDEVALEFEDEALELIAEKAMKKETGARALRSILEEYMLDIMYEIPRDNAIGRVIITRDYLEGKGGPRIILRGMDQLTE